TMITMRRTIERCATFTKLGAAPRPWASRLKGPVGGLGTGLLAESKYAKLRAVTLSASSVPFEHVYDGTLPIGPETPRRPVASRQNVYALLAPVASRSPATDRAALVATWTEFERSLVLSLSMFSGK